MMKFFRKILHLLGFRDPVQLFPMDFYIGDIEGESFEDVKSRFEDVNFLHLGTVVLPEEYDRVCIWHDFKSTYWLVEYFEKPE